MISKDDLAEIAAAMSKLQDDKVVKDRHACWKKRCILVAVVATGFGVVGWYMHEDVLFKGWEFVAAAVVDKLIFGVA